MGGEHGTWALLNVLKPVVVALLTAVALAPLYRFI